MKWQTKNRCMHNYKTEEVNKFTKIVHKQRVFDWICSNTSRTRPYAKGQRRQSKCQLICYICIKLTNSQLCGSGSCPESTSQTKINGIK